MGIFSWLNKRYRRKVRNTYNKGDYKKSLRQGLICWRIFNDKIGLDVAARSSLRLKKYDNATKMYRTASKKNIKLRDNGINHFEAELKSGNLVEAFKLLKLAQAYPEKNPTNQLLKELNKIPKFDLFYLLKEMNAHDDLPIEIANLIPEASEKIPDKKRSSNYTILKNEIMDKDRYKREIIRVTSSTPYRIGQHFTEAYRRPWKILFLPFSIPYLAFNIIKEKNENVDFPSFLPSDPSRTYTFRRCIILFPTNGVGFGHFTRLLSIANRMKKIDKDLEIIFFTTMPTLHISENMGFPSYHMPGRYKYEDMGTKEWNSLAEEMLSLIFSIHRPSAFIFDGSYPYRGMLNAIRAHPKILKIWLRRGAIKNNSKTLPSDSLSHFDGVIIPGDSVKINSKLEVDSGIPILRCNPITLLDPNEYVKKGVLRSMLGIPKEALVAYVQLGAGRINNINNDLIHTLDSLDKHENLYTVFAESIIGERYSFDYERLRILRDYPNSMFFNDFDFAIMAGGYNSFHEVVQSGLPTICYPNMKTGRDDQLSRCLVAQEAGSMVVIETRSKKKITSAINRLVNDDVRAKMKARSKLLQRDNGAKEAAKWILSHID